MAKAFDNEALIFVPSNGVIMMRCWRTEATSPVEAAALEKYHDMELQWPSKVSARPHLPLNASATTVIGEVMRSVLQRMRRKASSHFSSSSL